MTGCTTARRACGASTSGPSDPLRCTTAHVATVSTAAATRRRSPRRASAMISTSTSAAASRRSSSRPSAAAAVQPAFARARSTNRRPGQRRSHERKGCSLAHIPAPGWVPFAHENGIRSLAPRPSPACRRAAGLLVAAGGCASNAQPRPRILGVTPPRQDRDDARRCSTSSQELADETDRVVTQRSARPDRVHRRASVATLDRQRSDPTAPRGRLPHRRDERDLATTCQSRRSGRAATDPGSRALSALRWSGVTVPRTTSPSTSRRCATDGPRAQRRHGPPTASRSQRCSTRDERPRRVDRGRTPRLRGDDG